MSSEEKTTEQTVTIIDVRSPLEFQGGHVAGSINIPLQEIPMRIEDLRQMQAPLILCCASGNRSGQAQKFLAQFGIDCINGGSWINVNNQYSQTI